MDYPKLTFIPKRPTIPSGAVEETRLLTKGQFLQYIVPEDANDIMASLENVATRKIGQYAGRALWLDQEAYDWVLGRDNCGELCLVPLKKKEDC